MTVDLAAVPRLRPGRWSRADPERRGACSRSGMRTPTRTRSARRSASCRIVEALGGTADPVCTDPVPPLYDFLAGIERFRTDPDPEAAYDLLVVSDCGTARSGRRRADAPCRAVRAAAAGRHRSPRLERRRPAMPTGSTPTPPRPARWSRCWPSRLGVPLDARRRCAGHRADGRDRDGHLDLRAPECDATDAGRRRRARRGRRAALRYLAPPLPIQADGQLRLFGRVLDRLESVDDGRVVCSTLFDADLAATGAEPPQSEGIIDLLAQSDEAEVAILFKEAGPATRISVRTKPGGVDATVLTGAFGGGGHARAGRRHRRSSRSTRGRDRGPRRGPAARRRRCTR